MPAWKDRKKRRLYERLIRDALPGETVGNFRLHLEGGQTIVFEVDHRFIFRFPRSAFHAKLLRTETRLLPLLAPYVPLPIPRPIATGRTPDGEGWPFMGYRRIPGRPLNWDRVSPQQRHAIAEDLSPFLESLVKFPPQAALRVGVRGGGPKDWKAQHEKDFVSYGRKGFRVMSPKIRRSVERLFERYLDDPRNFRWKPCLTHSEIHAGHVLTIGGRVSGIIDWGFVCVGDPARDLAGWASHFGTQEIDLLSRGRVAPTDTTFVDRVMLYRSLIPLYQVLYGVETKDPKMTRSGLLYLNRALRLPSTSGWTRVRRS